MLGRIGSTLAFVTALVHALVGTYDTLLPLLVSDLSLAVIGTFHACWHFVTVFLLYSAWVFWKKLKISSILATLWGVFGVIFLVVAFYHVGISGLLILPQWILLGAVSALMLWEIKNSNE